MAQVTVNIDPGVKVVAKLSFKGVAKYSAYIFSPAGNDTWTHVRTLVEDASSIDARPDVLIFDAPQAGHHLLFFLSANMTALTVPSDISATSAFEQQNATKGEASESGHVDAGYSAVIVRALLVTP